MISNAKKGDPRNRELSERRLRAVMTLFTKFPYSNFTVKEVDKLIGEIGKTGLRDTLINLTAREPRYLRSVKVRRSIAQRTGSKVSIFNRRVEIFYFNHQREV